MDQQRLQEILDNIRLTRVLVFGDFCIDAYWDFDMAASEVSIETGKPTWPVRTQRYGLGGAGNVVSNLVALGVGDVHAIAVVGDDLYGREMVAMFRGLGVHADRVVVQAEQWDTPVYGKPHVDGVEQSRIDFGVFNDMAPGTEGRVAAAMRDALDHVDAVILNQQLPRGASSDSMIGLLNEIVAEHPETIFVVDSRDKSGLYEGVILKLNGHEAARLCGKDAPVDEAVPLNAVREYAAQIIAHMGKPVIVTRGEEGCVVQDGARLFEVPGVKVEGEVDPVGAGDTFVSALTAALAAGASPADAAALANIAAAVTVAKLRQTGTAAPEEIAALAARG